MNSKHLLAVAAVMLVLPATAHAEEGRVVQSTTNAAGYKETVVLKGYKVRTAERAAPAAPVAGQKYYYAEETYVPVENMSALPPPAGLEPASGSLVVHETASDHYVRPSAARKAYNE